MTRRPDMPGHPDSGDVDREDVDPDEADPGLFWERTELAWHRTGIAFAALGGAVIKTAPVVGLLILASSAPIFVLAHTSRPGGRRAGGAGQRRSLLLITIAVTAVALAALVLSFFAGDQPF